MKKKYYCHVSGEEIPSERAEFLLENGVAEDQLTCLKHSGTKKIQAIYEGEVGTSRLIFCKKVYNDSVRSVFRAAESEESISDDDVD